MANQGPYEIPLVLCGPMLRKVTCDQVCVFLALREPCKVRLTVWQDDGGKAGRPLMQGEQESLRLGSGLHVVLASAQRPVSVEVQWGTRCVYHLEFETTQGKKKLADPGVLDEMPVTELDRASYPGRAMPGFCLPPQQKEQLRVLHGSCRKPHGPGADALLKVDEIVAHAYEGRGLLPQQLFFTGDQIYADDVHAALLKGAQRVSEALLGTTEFDQLDPQHREFGQRAELVKAAGFTTGEGASHLVTLGEFLGMYLLVWSPALWGLAGLADHPDFRSFRAGLARVRRALAHVPTGMIFDDHEVTDDWNIRPDWVEKVDAQPLGRQIVRNALAAYAVFQHWGNAPEAFAAGEAGKNVLDALVDRGGVGAPAGLDDVLGGLSLRGQSLSWGWSWADNPLFHVVALDCRTRRPQVGKFSLMTEQNISKALALPANQPSFTIVISPTPVLGVRLLEAAQRLAERLGAVNNWDVEAWSQSAAYDHLVNQLLSRAPALLLSGDVHYGLVATAVAEEGKHKGRRIVNCTSSALKNQDERLVTHGYKLGGTTLQAAGGPTPKPEGTTYSVYVGPLSGILTEQVLGAPISALEGDVSMDELWEPQSDQDLRRTPVFALNNLGDLTWPGRLLQVLWGGGTGRPDEVTFK